MKMCLVLGGIVVALVSQLHAADWPQYRGPRGDGVSSAQIRNTQWGSTGPPRLWKTATPNGFSSFSVAGGRAFTLTAPEGDDGKKTETCVAMDASTGKHLWSVSFGASDYGHDGGNSGAPENRGGDGPRSTPASDGERVYVYDAHLMLSCLDASSGALIWQTSIADELGGQNIKWMNAVSPLLDDDHVYVPGGGAGQSFLAFDKLSGTILWKSGDETMTHATPSLTTIHGTRQIVFMTVDGLVSVRAGDGQFLWRSSFPFSVSTAASPIIDNDLVYCSAGYGVGAGLVRVDANHPTWEVDHVWRKANELMNHWSTPVLHDGYLYGIYEFKKYGKAPLQCVELATGEIQWSQRGFGPGNCILVGDHLVVLSDDGHLVLVQARPDAYHELSRAKVIDGKCWSTPAFSDGRVYVRSTLEGACVDLR